MSKAKVIEMFERVHRAYAAKALGNWADTPQRKLTRERNWCYYVLAGIEATSRSCLRPFMSKASFETWLRAINSARYSVDAGYYEKLDRLNRTK